MTTQLSRDRFDYDSPLVNFEYGARQKRRLFPLFCQLSVYMLPWVQCLTGQTTDCSNVVSMASLPTNWCSLVQWLHVKCTRGFEKPFNDLTKENIVSGADLGEKRRCNRYPKNEQWMPLFKKNPYDISFTKYVVPFVWTVGGRRNKMNASSI